jgi:hypothetical protein
MISISLIIASSGVLFAYWFRYSCLLILHSRTSESAPSAPDARFSFPSVQQRLKQGETQIDYLDMARRDLANDYRMLCFLLRCSAESGVDPLERRMLMLDYWTLQAWYAVTRNIAPPQARRALEEISIIVGYFASSVGPRTIQRSTA